MDSIAQSYHEATKHSPTSVQHSLHRLDFSNMPIPYKLYRDVPQLALPPPGGDPAVSALQAVGGDLEGPEHSPDLASLSRLLHHADGITRVLRSGAREYVFRAAACTGALYEIELYVVCRDLPGLSAGVYHYSPPDHALDILRQGDYRAMLNSAAPAVVVATGTYWRNAWKYEARTYRHFGWDNGTITANLLATATALRIPARLLVGFDDASAQRVLSLDGDKEVALTLVPLGPPGEVPPLSPDCPPLSFETEPLSPRGDVDYPLMRQMHAATASLAQWKVPAATVPAGPLGTPLPPPEASTLSLDDVIMRRGSTRHFAQSPLTLAAVSTVLQLSTRPVRCDFAPICDVYLIVNAVDGLEAGTYLYRNGHLQQLRKGDFRAEAGFLDLGQDLAADAALNVYFMANLDEVLEHYGDRGYRAVQLEAGLLGGRMYLCAYALGFGATGLTFFDDEVTLFFSPHAAGKSPIFLMALGNKA